ncbi:unnamed protein product, partial [Didymodactylos carnosus]
MLDRKRQEVENYVYKKLEQYTLKSRLWQIKNSHHIKRRLLEKAHRLSEDHSISEDIIEQWINQIIIRFDQYIQQIKALLSSKYYQNSDNNNTNDHIELFQKQLKASKWRTMQIQRAKQLRLGGSEDNDELLKQYYKYVNETLTPKKNE